MIDRIEVFPMRYSTFGHFKFFTGPHGSRGRAAVIVKIVSDDGSVVVGTMGPPTVPLRLAFIWTEDTGTMLLEQRLNLLGADIGDFSSLQYASGITADGKTIVGSTSGEGAWVITLPSDPEPGVPGRAGTGTLVVEDGVPLHLPLVPAPVRRPQPEVKTIENSVPKNNTGSVEFGSN